tara:strand:- start:679 stop:1020 length:342 start_codon:yes stop_codon:yes gene_type:complete
MMATKEFLWNADGHRILLTVNKAIVDVSPSICPHGATEDAPCYHEGINGCIVNHFVNVYGLEINSGVVPASASIEIAWAMSGSRWDADLADVRIIPMEDPNFQEWLDSQKADS